MKVQFLVTIEGEWLCNGKPATSVNAKVALREALKERFEFLTDKITVEKVVAQVANKPALTETPTQEAKP